VASLNSASSLPFVAGIDPDGPPCIASERGGLREMAYTKSAEAAV